MQRETFLQRRSCAGKRTDVSHEYGTLANRAAVLYTVTATDGSARLTQLRTQPTYKLRNVYYKLHLLTGSPFRWPSTQAGRPSDTKVPARWQSVQMHVPFQQALARRRRRPADFAHRNCVARRGARRVRRGFQGKGRPRWHARGAAGHHPCIPGGTEEDTAEVQTMERCEKGQHTPQAARMPRPGQGQPHYCQHSSGSPASLCVMS